MEKDLCKIATRGTLYRTASDAHQKSARKAALRAPLSQNPFSVVTEFAQTINHKRKNG
jgi:hypothetical protein